MFGHTYLLVAEKKKNKWKKVLKLKNSTQLLVGMVWNTQLTKYCLIMVSVCPIIERKKRSLQKTHPSKAKKGKDWKIPFRYMFFSWALNLSSHQLVPKKSGGMNPVSSVHLLYKVCGRHKTCSDSKPRYIQKYIFRIPIASNIHSSMMLDSKRLALSCLQSRRKIRSSICRDTSNVLFLSG